MRMILTLVGFLFWLVPTTVHAQSGPCKENETFPIGTANQGGYRFDYDSGRGDQCRTYHLRNTPGKLLTPAEWKDSAEVFLSVDLPECTAGSDCPWTDAVKITEAVKGPTALTYGVNKDEFKESPNAFRMKERKKSEFTPYDTLIRGVVADTLGKSRRIGIEVSSYAYPDADGYRLLYKIELVGDSEPFRLLQSQPREGGLVLSWESVGSGSFSEYLSRNKFNEL